MMIYFYSDTPADQEVRLQNTLYTLEKAGLKVNPDKCLLRQKWLNYLGHYTDEDGICLDEAKIQAITQLEPPRNVSDLRRILGMIHYLGRYQLGLANVNKPLNDLLKSDSTCTCSAGGGF